jgi:hypothetical protein
MKLNHLHHFGPLRSVWLALIFAFSSVLYFASGYSIPEREAEPKTNETIIRDFQTAFNKHDVSAMLALVADDLQWFNVQGSKVEIEIEGKPALEKWLTGYFKSCPSCRSEIESLMSAGSYVTVHERAMWETKTGKKSQKSLAVYEVRDGSIRHVWYFPAEK